MGHGPAIGGRFWARRFRRNELSSLLHDLQVFFLPASLVEKNGNSFMSFSFLQLRQIFVDIYSILYVSNTYFLLFLFWKIYGSDFFCVFYRGLWRVLFCF